MISRKDKMQAFIDRIMKECEQEGFALSEVSMISTLFNAAASKQIRAIEANTKFTGP